MSLLFMSRFEYRHVNKSLSITIDLVYCIVLRGSQIRVTRAVLGWSQQRLADEAQIGIATVQRAERAERPPLTASNLFAIERALEAAGIEFIDDDERPGLRWRHPRP